MDVMEKIKGKNMETSIGFNKKVLKKPISFMFD